MKKLKSGKTIGIILVILGIVVCVVALVILMKGETKTSGQKISDIKGESLACENQDIHYPFTDYDKSKAKELKIAVSFYDDNIDAISLMYTLRYDDEQQVKASEASNHADMNISFSKNGLSADALSARYSKMKDSMVMSLYAKKDDLSSVTAKYFMIELRNQTDLPATLTEYQDNYERQGFVCKISS